MEALYLSSFGGSGENGRNCHLIGTSGKNILLDCGVMREIRDGKVGVYPLLTEEAVADIGMCFLSHCHEDHVAALPLLYQMGYKGKIYASAETVRMTVPFIRKWIHYVERSGGTLPYDKKYVDSIQFEEVSPGVQEIDELRVEAGRSGHVLGGLWFRFLFPEQTVLYTGDMCRDSLSIAWDCPGVCDVAVVDAAYAGKTISQAEQYRKLEESVRETVRAGGNVLLPVPPKGRGIDILCCLQERLPEVHICADKAVVEGRESLVQKKEWTTEKIRRGKWNEVEVIDSPSKRKEALGRGKTVFLAADGMLTTEDSLEIFEALKGGKKNRIIVTGHGAAGTPVWGVFRDEYRREHKVEMQAEKLVVKVHQDDADVEDLCRKTGAGKVMLFHADACAAASLCRTLASRGIRAENLIWQEKLEI